MAFTPKQTCDGAYMATTCRHMSDTTSRDLPGTPPADVLIKAGLLAHGS